MQTLSENKRNNDSNDIKKPSLLRQIVDKVDLLTEVEQHQLLLQLNKDELLAKAQKVDKKFKGAFKKMTKEEITLMVSQERKKIMKKHLIIDTLVFNLIDNLIQAKPDHVTILPVSIVRANCG